MRCFVHGAGLMGATLFLAGCATVTRGTHGPFQIISTPSGAVAQLSTGESCVTPCHLDMRRADPFQVRLSKAGYVTQTVSVRSIFNGASTVGLLSNAVVGGIVGASVDMSSGAMQSLTPNPLRVQLLAVTEAPSEAPAAAAAASPAQSPPAPPSAALPEPNRSDVSANAATAAPAHP